MGLKSMCICNANNPCVQRTADGQMLEPFQNYNINVSELDKYERFYRVVCDPLHSLRATDFFSDLDDLE